MAARKSADDDTSSSPQSPEPADPTTDTTQAGDELDDELLAADAERTALLEKNRANREKYAVKYRRQARRRARDNEFAARENNPDADDAEQRSDEAQTIHALKIWLAVVSVIAVAAIGAAFYLGLRDTSDPAPAGDVALNSQVYDEVLRTAQQYAIDFGTIDTSNPKAWEAKLTAESTGVFVQNYLGASAADALKGIGEADGVTTASVPPNGAAVLSIDDTSAKVLVSLDQLTKSPKYPSDLQKQSRLVISLEKPEGRWLLAGFDFV